VGVTDGGEVGGDVGVFVLVGVGVFEGREVAGEVDIFVFVGVGLAVAGKGGVAEALGTDVCEYCAVGVGEEEYKDVDVALATADGAVEGSEVWVPSANWVAVGSPAWSEPGVADGSWSVGAASEPSSAVQYGVSVATIGA